MALFTTMLIFFLAISAVIIHLQGEKIKTLEAENLMRFEAFLKMDLALQLEQKRVKELDAKADILGKRVDDLIKRYAT